MIRSDDDSKEEYEDDETTDSENESYGSYPKKRRARKSGAAFVLIFLAGFISMMALAINGMGIQCAIVFGCLFAFGFLYFGIMLGREHVIFSTSVDPNKYVFAEGRVEDCVLVNDMNANGIQLVTYKITAIVGGKRVKTYARIEYNVGDVVRLAVHKNGKTAKIVDENNRAVFSYDYLRHHDHIYHTPSARDDDDSEERDLFSDTMDLEDKLYSDLERVSMFDEYDEYSQEADALWEEWTGSDSDSDNEILKRICALAESYREKYLSPKRVDEAPEEKPTIDATSQAPTSDEKKQAQTDEVVTAPATAASVTPAPTPKAESTPKPTPVEEAPAPAATEIPQSKSGDGSNRIIGYKSIKKK